MADRLTQLQDCYDQLATQFYASIRYISIHHNSSTLTPPPPPTPHTTHNSNNTPNHQTEPSQPSQLTQSEQPDPSSLPPEQIPDTPEIFAAAQRELAQDLLLKAKQIEILISVLPGVENSQEKQEARIRELDAELRTALEERAEVEEERSMVLGRVEALLGGVRR